jgi:hypothetical protein
MYGPGHILLAGLCLSKTDRAECSGRNGNDGDSENLAAITVSKHFVTSKVRVKV